MREKYSIQVLNIPRFHQKIASLMSFGKRQR